MSRPRSPDLRIAMVGAGVMARAHSIALHTLAALYPDPGRHPRLVAVSDVNRSLATDLAERFGYERVEDDWRSIVSAADVDLVVACLPPVLNRDVVLAAAAAGKHIVCEKPLAVSAAVAAEMLTACRTAGVFHGLGAGYRWSPALRAIHRLIDRGDLGEIRSLRASFLLDYAADPDVPLAWRFRRDLAGGGLAIDTGYHLVDTARFLVGEIVGVQGLTSTFITQRRLPGADAIGNRGEGAGEAQGELAEVDVEDAAAALLTFANGAYGVLETSRIMHGKRVSMLVEVYGSKGSADWDLERPDEFRVCLPGDPSTFGYRRVMVNPSHPGASDLLIAGTDGTGIGWLGFEVAMWVGFLKAIAEGRSVHADFVDGVAANAVIDALYASASSGMRTPVVMPPGVDPAARRTDEVTKADG
ncbi:MAG: Gfo/Idh/MocA family oxidoreductase [Candidatus Limnocylindrales bacterium]